MLKQISLGIILLLVTGCYTVRGVVKDKTTSSPIPSAVVTNTRLNVSSTTNAVGQYKLYGLFLPGDVIMVNAPGYNITTQTQTSPSQIVDIELQPK